MEMDVKAIVYLSQLRTSEMVVVLQLQILELIVPQDIIKTMLQIQQCE